MSSTALSRGITRRSFLALPALVPLAAWANGAGADEHYFQYDFVLGTSLDLVVWTRDAAAAAAAEAAVMEEIGRLASILSTRDPESEISRLGERDDAAMSPELAAVLSAYAYWNRRTGGVIAIRPYGPDTPRNVDALGKAFIIDRAAHAAFTAARGIDGVLLNIGGDIVARGRPCEIQVANPHAAADNAPPLTAIRLHNAAAATSGTYARGAHLFDARTGKAKALAAGATVVAPNAVTANALSTALCLTEANEGMALVERVPGAEALRAAASQAGGVLRTSGFAALEIPIPARVAVVADWPAGYELSMSLTLVNPAPGAGRGGPGGGFGGVGGGRGGPGGGRGGPGGAKRLYVAVWIENAAGKLVRVLAFWADKARFYNSMSTFYGVLGRNQDALFAVARATRGPGAYQLIWDGLDDQQKPVPPGSYRVVVETNREHGQYAKQAGVITCGDSPATATLSATGNFEAVTLQYGPKPKSA